MNSEYVFAIDQGTTNTKAALVTTDGRIAFSASAPMRLYQPWPGWVEQDAEEIWTSVCEVLEACVRSVAPGSIAALAISNQRETVVAWERSSGQPVAPAILWQCRRSVDICRELERRSVTEMLRQRTGLAVDPLFSATKIQWLLENVQGLRERAEAGEIIFGTVDSWLISKLTGGRVHACDMSNASRTQLFNLRARAWDGELTSLFNIPRVSLPEVRESSGVFGVCSAVEGLMGVPILGAIGDSHAAMAAQGVPASGGVKATYGTGSSVVSLLPELRIPQPGLAATVAWSIAGDTRYALEGNISMSGAALQWVGELLGLPDPIEGAAALAATVENSGGVSFVPAMLGLGAPYWNSEARGVVIGLERASRGAHLARAAVEAIAHQVTDVFERMEAEWGAALPALHADGGATRNDSLMQFQADMLDRPVLRSRVEELSIAGAACMAGVALGWWSSPHAMATLREPPEVFEPCMSAADRQRLRAQWKIAVECAQKRSAQ
jgi:glycerol kinase